MDWHPQPNSCLPPVPPSTSESLLQSTTLPAHSSPPPVTQTHPNLQTTLQVLSPKQAETNCTLGTLKLRLFIQSLLPRLASVLRSAIAKQQTSAFVNKAEFRRTSQTRRISSGELFIFRAWDHPDHEALVRKRTSGLGFSSTPQGKKKKRKERDEKD